ncbi:MAG: alpha-glucosidase C-terminal domain-containing protein [Alphaproteobacteria bacterium]
MPWDADAPNLGFTSGTPWLPLGPAHAALAVSAQDGDPNSALAYTRKLAAARRAHPALRHGSLELLPGPMLAFVRRAGEEAIVCVFNLTQAPAAMELPGPATPMDLGTGDASLSGPVLTLSGHGSFFGLL